MKTTLTITIFFISTMCSSGQVPRWHAEDYVKQISADSCMIYSYQCNSLVSPAPDSCKSEPAYLFWIKKGKYFFKKFDNCGEFDTMPIDISNPLKFYFENRFTIDRSEIKPPAFYKLRRIGNKTDTFLLRKASISNKIPMHKKQRVPRECLSPEDFAV